MSDFDKGYAVGMALLIIWLVLQIVSAVNH